MQNAHRTNTAHSPYFLNQANRILIWVSMAAMSPTFSINTVDSTPKHNLPTKQSVTAVTKPYRSTNRNTIDNTSPTNFQKIVAELMGTYILIFAGCAAALVDKVQSLTIVGISLVWGLALMAVIYTLGHVSGAHFNPAVSLALAAANKFNWKHVPMYVLAQLVGATLASLTLRVLFNFNNQDDLHVIATQYADSTTDLQAITWEFIITFILMFTILGVATDERASNGLAGVAIGGTLLFNVMIAGPITGASMNPARSLGPAVASGVYKNLWVFIVAPVVGALAAALVYSVLRVPKTEIPERESTKSVYNELYFHSDP